jgi:ribosome-binding protein aMBF1 (putative translation factor)
MSAQTRATIPDINNLALQNARLAQGISKEDLAKKLCLSMHHIDKLEANELKLFSPIGTAI